ncbi:MAG: hypothetical protein ACRDTT_17245, partial [Pseudonocardiaceae bacterium]
LTRIAALCLSGEGFHITSARARIIQNDADAWARFPAFAGFAPRVVPSCVNAPGNRAAEGGEAEGRPG